MPKIDIAAVPARKGSGYPALPPGGWSSQRHWHSSNTDGRFVHKDGTPHAD